MISYLLLALLGIVLIIGLLGLVMIVTVMFIFHKSVDEALRFIRRGMRE